MVDVDVQSVLNDLLPEPLRQAGSVLPVHVGC